MLESSFMSATLADSAPDFNQRLLAELDALYRTARYLTGDAALAEDMVQEVAVKAIQGKGAFRHEADFRPWIFTILRHTVTDYYRRRGTHPVPLSLEDDNPELPLETSPDNGLFEHVLDEEVVQALAELPEEMRLAVLLADIEEFSYQEIAQVLGWPLGSVMSRLHRGRQKLRQRLLVYAKNRGYQI